MTFTILLSLILTNFSYADVCSYMKEKYSSALDIETIYRKSIKDSLEKMGRDAGTELVESHISLRSTWHHETELSRQDQIQFDLITAKYKNGHQIEVCAGRVGECEANLNGGFSWAIRSEKTSNSLGEVTGATCTLTTYPVPFLEFYNRVTGARVLINPPETFSVTEEL